MPTAKTKKPAVRKPKTAKQAAVKSFYEGVGRRKTATARVRLFGSQKGFLINDKTLEGYFPTPDLQQIVKSPLDKLDFTDKFKVSARVRGGGFHAQAEAVRHGIAKALIIFDEELRKRMKKTGFLTRDPRMRERKKPGLKRARRAPQWRKR